MGRVCILLASAGLLSGCFVLDEIDSGMEMMEKNSPPPAEAKAEPGDGEEEGPPSRSEWWSKARSLDHGAADADDGEPDDPQAMVRCEIGDSTRFTRRGNCLSQGGRPRS